MRWHDHCGESNVHGCEVGGILVGYRYERTPEAGGPVQHFVTLTDLIPVESCDRSEAHVCFDEDAWEDIERQMNERFAPRKGNAGLGWYHTHPSQGIFFSGQDRDAHTVFQRAHQFALVIDPRVMEAGLFYWLDYDARVLAGPLRFPVASASPAESAIVTADAHSDRPMHSFHPLPNLHWVRFAAFWALAGLLSGYIAGRGSACRIPGRLMFLRRQSARLSQAVESGLLPSAPAHCSHFTYGHRSGRDIRAAANSANGVAHRCPLVTPRPCWLFLLFIMQRAGYPPR